MSSIANAIITEAQRQGVDPALALEVATAESGMNINAPDSAAGAIGIFQLMPATAAGLGVNPLDPAQNIQGGISYLRQLLAQFGDPVAALAAYDWGPGNVQQAMAIYGQSFLASAPSETQNYVAKIFRNIQTQYSAVASYAASQGGASPGGGTSTLSIPSGLLPGSPGPAPQGFSWGAVALVVGIILGVGLVLQQA